MIEPVAAGLRIFLNYRREDAPGHAGRLYDALAERFGKDHVFMDVDTIAPGEDFADVLDSAVSGCESFIAVIGRDWVSTATADGERRLDDPNDFVRIEIEAALKRGIPVIPALVENARMPRAEELPEELAPLARRQAAFLSDERWRYDVGRLIEILERVQARATTDSGTEAESEKPPATGGTIAGGASPPRVARGLRGVPRLVWILVAAAAVAIAAAAAFLALSSSPSSFQLDGRVLDTRTHRPAAGITVTSKGKSVRTGRDGTFSLGVGKNTPVQISGCGYATTTIRATPGTGAKQVSLRPLRAIGTVTSDFSPVPLIDRLTWQNRTARSSLVYDPGLGRVVAYGVCPGSTIRVAAPGHAPSNAHVDQHRRFHATLQFTRIHDSSSLQLIKAGDDSFSRGFYRGGAYVLAAKELNQSGTYEIRSKPLTNTALDATVVLESGHTNDGVEFVCRSKARSVVENEYDLDVSNDGYVRVARYAVNGERDLVKWRKSRWVHTGVGVPNKISARCVGRKHVALELWVNGSLAVRAVDPHGFSRGKVGFGLLAYKKPFARVRLQDVSVRRLPER